MRILDATRKRNVDTSTQSKISRRLLVRQSLRGWELLRRESPTHPLRTWKITESTKGPEQASQVVRYSESLTSLYPIWVPAEDREALSKSHHELVRTTLQHSDDGARRMRPSDHLCKASLYIVHGKALLRRSQVSIELRTS